MPTTCLMLPKTRLALAAAALVAGAGLATPVLAKTPVGGEFRANTFTTNSQQNPAIAMDADGDFVVVWESINQDGSSYGVYAQRYNASGVAQGGEFRVNTFTTGNQQAPAVAMDASGDFVVTWRGNGLDDSNGIYAQRYSATGVAQGTEFLVNTETSNLQTEPAIAIDADGDFVVTWSGYGPFLEGYEIYAQRYNASGVAQGSEFQVNTVVIDNQTVPTVAMDADGDFVVAWQSYYQDGDSDGIYAQRYNRTGTSVGSEFKVNTFTTNRQRAPAIALDADGDFVVAWHSAQDGSGYGVYAQRYNASGVALGGEFRVNSYTTNTQSMPTIAMDADGDFVVSWSSSGQDGNDYGVYAQRYSATGLAQGAEFKANTFTTLRQLASAVALDADGDFAITWSSASQDGAGTGIYAQRYQADTLTPSLAVTTSGATTNTTAVPGGPGGTYSFNAQFCNNTALNMTGLSSKTLTLDNGNNLLNRSRDALAAPGAAAISAGGPGSEKDLTGTTVGYADLRLTNGECVTVPYQIGLTNRNRFNFTIRIRGDNGQ